MVIKIGRPDFATEAMGINEGDTYLLLRPMETWTRFHTKEALIEAVAKELRYDSRRRLQLHAADGDAHRRNDLRRQGRSGHQGLRRRFPRRSTRSAQQVLRAVSSVRGAADAQMEITSGVAELSVRVRSIRARALRPERHRCRRGGGQRRVRRS